jgi:ribonuclease P protein component
VRRNRLKRLVREHFRLHEPALPAVDVVVNARPAATRATNDAIRASLAAHWDRIARRCARS